MKPEIRFRGKKISNKWIYGVLTYCHNYIYNDDSIDSFDNYEVIPETITQFTGLKDKNGVDLYEGDLFKCGDSDIIYRVWMVKGGFAINTNVKRWQSDIKRNFPFPVVPLADEQTVSWVESNSTIIGNIFDNPEIINL